MTPAFLDVAGIKFRYLKGSKFAMEILANYRSPYFCNSIKTLDRSTLCTATPNTSYLQKHYIGCSKMELGLNNPITRVNHW